MNSHLYFQNNKFSTAASAAFPSNYINKTFYVPLGFSLPTFHPFLSSHPPLPPSSSHPILFSSHSLLIPFSSHPILPSPHPLLTPSSSHPIILSPHPSLTPSSSHPILLSTHPPLTPSSSHPIFLSPHPPLTPSSSHILSFHHLFTSSSYILTPNFLTKHFCRFPIEHITITDWTRFEYAKQAKSSLSKFIF